MSCSITGISLLAIGVAALIAITVFLVEQKRILFIYPVVITITIFVFLVGYYTWMHSVAECFYDVLTPVGSVLFLVGAVEGICYLINSKEGAKTNK